MKNILIDQYWKKKNIITLKRGKQLYDIYQHDSGVEGKRYGFTEELVLTEKDFKKYSVWMAKTNKTLNEQMVIIVRCDACGPQFANITPNSKHLVIKAPDGEKDDDRGVWVMGVGEPVKLLNNEFKYLKQEKL